MFLSLDASVDEPQRAQYENQVQIFELVELIWGLCEILLIDIPASRYYYKPVMIYYNVHIAWQTTGQDLFYLSKWRNIISCN